MRTRTFAGFATLPLLAFLVWAAYDATRPDEKVGSDTKVRYELLKSGEGYGAVVQFHFRFVEPVVIHDKSADEIKALQEQRGSETLEKILGLTVGSFKQDCTYTFKTRKKFLSKGYLLWVEDLKVAFSCDDLKVYVDRDYAVGSCEYEETLKHELEHVAIHRELHDRYGRKLEEALASARGIPSRARPLLVGDPEEGRKRLGELLSSVVDPVFEAYQKELGDKEAAIDTPANYRGIQSRCSNW